ncbi:MAG: hypothetical protein ACE5IP_13215 [Terriglobia bacterium]
MASVTAAGSTETGKAESEAVVVQPAARRQALEERLDVGCSLGARLEFAAELARGLGAASQRTEGVLLQLACSEAPGRAAGRAFSP